MAIRSIDNPVQDRNRSVRAKNKVLYDKGEGESTAKTLLIELSKSGIDTFEPTFEHEIGFRYPYLDGFGLREQLAILDGYGKEGLATSELYKSVLICPKCESTRFSVQPLCSVCKSTNLTRGSVIEHLLCGNIDFDIRYARAEEPSELVCPKCRKQLKAIGVDYARPGIFYSCLNCKALLPKAENTHTCLECMSSWTEAELKELQLLKYKIDLEKVSRQFAHTGLLPAVAQNLYSKYGVKAESPGIVKGLSKVEHSFDLLISHFESGEPVLAADLLDDDKSSNIHQNAAMRILAFYTKCLDANYLTSNVIKKILVTQSAADEKIRELSSAYGITIVQTGEVNELTSLIIKMLAPEQTLDSEV